MLNEVVSVIKQHIADENIIFVFPSQTSARLWAIKTCVLGIARSVAVNRFLAWDRFKEDAFLDMNAGGSPASSVIRKLFAESLVRKNAESPFFKSIIPAEYAENGTVFAPSIARLLPSLAWWEKAASRANVNKSQYVYDDEDDDYKIVKTEYTAFLERSNLFEPSWEEVKLRDDKKRYVIFFPELMEDFAEYNELLDPHRFIRIHTVTSNCAPLHEFRSVREEIRSAVMELQRLHAEENVPYEEMAISVPELDEIEPCLFRELKMRHVPFVRRAGKKLGKTGTGCLFSLLREYASSRFSFNSLKALVLNDHIPWRDRRINKDLVRFGIDYNCVTGYIMNSKVEDIWEEAFREPGAWKKNELQPYYRKLKDCVLSITGSKSFSEIRKYYFVFKNSFLDMEKISAEDDAVLSRCIEELSSLIDISEKLDDPSLVPASAFGFFVSERTGIC